MKYQKTILVTDARQLVKNPPQCGQWIQLAWCDRPSRFHSAGAASVCAFHYPNAAVRFVNYVRAGKANDAFAAFNRRARELSNVAA